MQHLQALVDDMHSEFKAYSSANGRDTEQVLDALKDGLDTLRAEIESYVDRAQDVTHKDEIIDNVRGELERLRVDVQGYVAEGPRGDHAWDRGDMVSYIKSEFEHLHEELSSQFLPAAKDKEDIIDALNAGFEGMKSQVVTRGEDLDTNEEINEAMKQEFDQLKDVILGDTSHQKEEIIETLQAGFDGLHSRLGESTALAGSNDEVLASIKEEFEHLRETLGGTLVRSSGSADKDDIIDAVRELIDGLRSQVTSTQEDSSKGGLASIHEEIEQLKESLSNTLVRSGESLDKEEILDALRTGLEEIKAGSSSIGINEELLEAFRGELEQVRQSNGLTRQHARADTEEVLEAVRLGLDDLRSHMEKKLDNPESHMSATGEIIDSLNEGLESLRSDVTKIVDKPVDMTVSYEILDTLKEGIAGLREDIEKIKGAKERSETEEQNEPTGNEVVLAEDPDNAASREIVSESLQRNDLEKMEVMLAQLQIKVEAMDANIQNPAPAPATDSAPHPGSAMKDDLVGIEELLKDLQAAVVTLQEREPVTASVEGMALKEDTDAIETLLGNVKAKIDEIVFPDPTTLVTKENLDDVELVVRTTSETIEELSKKISEEGATKGDVAVVQVIVDDIKVILDEMKTAKPEEEEVVPKATKDDVDSLAVLVCEIKAKVEEMKIPDAEELPSKADLEQLTGLLHDFRDSHEKLRDSYENDVQITAGVYDDRKKEAKELMENLAEVKLVLDDVKEDIKTNLAEGAAFVDIKESFKTLEDTMGASLNINADVKELMETVSREFERAHGAIEGLHNGQEEKSALALEKHDEAKDAIIAGLVEKVDDRFNTLMTKYDDAQLLADEQARVMKEKAEEQEKILESTKAMADELKLTIDTLGASITGMNDRFQEATEKMTSDSATVFGKIDETMAKLEEQKLDDKTEHSHTRDEIANVERIFNGLQDNITEYHPKFMVTLREIEALVKAHYEHSQKSKEAADEQVRTMNEEARTRAQELSNHFTSLPALLPAPPPAIEPTPAYDDTQLQEKLDKIIDHTGEAEKTTAQLERLDEIHKQVMATAAEVTDFVAKQTQLITDGNEAKEREAEEVGLVLERRRAQKEQLEADIESLKLEKERVMEELKAEKERVMAELKEEKDRTLLEVKEEKDSLLAVVAALQGERENLANQKVRLTGEVSSLHTALDIRREELNYMDAKADALERRILNGIMDHSRALMIAKGGPKSPNKAKKRMSVNITDEASKLMPPPSTAASALNMALKPRPAIRRNGPPANPASRRILSLSQISGNAPTGAQAYPVNGNMMNNTNTLKRSHSVKTNYLRKSSWGGRPSGAIANKENEALSEADEAEPESNPGHVQIDDNHSIIEEEYPESETGTERRHSFVSGSYEESYAEGETPGYDGRSSFGGTGSDYTYASGSSYMTGSDVDRRTSYGSTAARSTLAGGETIDEGSEDEASHHSEPEAEAEDDEPTATVPPPALTPSDPNTEPAPSEIAPSEFTASEVSTSLPTQSEVDAAVEAVKDDLKNDMRIYGPPSDSGVGTDLPTALIGNESEADADYFRRIAEEEGSMVG
jgi:DNA repair exonuclease SbcCD ATPase subunit